MASSSSWRFGAHRRHGIGWRTVYGDYEPPRQTRTVPEVVGQKRYAEVLRPEPAEEEEWPRKATRASLSSVAAAAAGRRRAELERLRSRGEGEEEDDDDGGSEDPLEGRGAAAGLGGDIGSFGEGLIFNAASGFASPAAADAFASHVAGLSAGGPGEAAAAPPAQPEFVELTPTPVASRGSAAAAQVHSSQEEGFVAEVKRIVRCGATAGYHSILGLERGARADLQAAQSRYRQLMRVLHPDKRREEEELRAGGKEVCDEAVRLVQLALESAKGDASALAAAAQEEDPQRERLRRMQEIQRQQARQAMRRHQQEPEPAPAPGGGATAGAGPAEGQQTRGSSVGSDAQWGADGRSATAGSDVSGSAPSSGTLLQDITKLLARHTQAPAQPSAPRDPREDDRPRDPRLRAAADGPPGGSRPQAAAASTATTAQIIDLLAGLR